MAKNKATPQQKLFIDEWIRLRKKNQTQAAINAGYSKKTAQQQSSQLLVNTKVLEYLKVREKQLEQELREEFMFDAKEARKIMYEIMRDDETPHSVRLNAAKDFLDRAGFKPVDQQQVELTGELNITNLTDEQLQEKMKKLEGVTDE